VPRTSNRSRNPLPSSETCDVFSRVDLSVGVGGLVKAGFDVEQAQTLFAESANIAASEIGPRTGMLGNLSPIAAHADLQPRRRD
jgi:hypothetical protein